MNIVVVEDSIYVQESLKAFGHAMSIPGNAALESALDPWFGLLWLEWV